MMRRAHAPQIPRQTGARVRAFGVYPIMRGTAESPGPPAPRRFPRGQREKPAAGNARPRGTCRAV